MKKIVIGAIVTLAIALIYNSWQEGRQEKAELEESSAMIREAISNVSKLVVTEGNFAQVYTYKDAQQLFGPFITARKKALVVVNAEVSVQYDLSQVGTEIDQESKTLRLTHIPEPEIKINPDLKYYDITADYLNPFNAEDYNKIKQDVNALLLKKVRASSMRSNAQNRLLSELSKFYVLTNSLGWSLEYNGNTISDPEQFQSLDQGLIN